MAKHKRIVKRKPIFRNVSGKLTEFKPGDQITVSDGELTAFGDNLTDPSAPSPEQTERAKAKQFETDKVRQRRESGKSEGSGNGSGEGGQTEREALIDHLDNLDLEGLQSYATEHSIDIDDPDLEENDLRDEIKDALGLFGPDLDAMDLGKLQQFATAHGIEYHPATKEKRMREVIREALAKEE